MAVTCAVIVASFSPQRRSLIWILSLGGFFVISIPSSVAVIRAAVSSVKKLPALCFLLVIISRICWRFRSERLDRMQLTISSKFMLVHWVAKTSLHYCRCLFKSLLTCG